MGRNGNIFGILMEKWEILEPETPKMHLLFGDLMGGEGNSHFSPLARGKNGGKWEEMGGNGEKWGKMGKQSGKGSGRMRDML